MPEQYRIPVKILEQAVRDAALGLDLRESALRALDSHAAFGPLHRCGLELARQLDHPDATSRFNAATLMHLIDPTTLAGINISEETP